MWSVFDAPRCSPNEIFMSSSIVRTVSDVAVQKKRKYLSSIELIANNSVRFEFHWTGHPNDISVTVRKNLTRKLSLCSFFKQLNIERRASSIGSLFARYAHIRLFRIDVLIFIRTDWALNQYRGVQWFRGHVWS